jgi:hypothetical protein
MLNSWVYVKASFLLLIFVEQNCNILVKRIMMLVDVITMVTLGKMAEVAKFLHVKW